MIYNIFNDVTVEVMNTANLIFLKKLLLSPDDRENVKLIVTMDTFALFIYATLSSHSFF